jgi:DNA polymerase alpha subunit B
MQSEIAIPEPPSEEPKEPRIKLKANTDMSKFSYRTMAMKLSEASEVLDDRIDEFRDLLRESTGLDESAFGNPNYASPSEIIAVGRIASDTSEGKLNTASLVLEGSRRHGSGRRVPLNVEGLSSYDFFPGQIVALRGTNASGDSFVVSEILSLPLLNPPATKPEELDAINARYLDTPDSDPENVRPLTIMIASGPYTTDQNLDFAPLHAFLDNAAEVYADSIILVGPFLDAEHPQIRSGDFDAPPNVSPDQATMTDLFRHHVSSAIQSFNKRVPTCNVLLVPSLRDAHHHHAAFPQDKFIKKELGLGAATKMVQCVTNPMTVSMNEMTVGMSSIDILDMLRREEVAGGKARSTNIYERCARNVLEQRSFLPVFPPTGREKQQFMPAPIEEKVMKNGTVNTELKEGDEAAEEQLPSPFLPLGTMVDTSYLKLGEMLNVRPDILVTPSVLQGTVKVCWTVLPVKSHVLIFTRSLSPCWLSILARWLNAAQQARTPASSYSRLLSVKQRGRKELQLHTSCGNGRVSIL